MRTITLLTCVGCVSEPTTPPATLPAPVPSSGDTGLPPTPPVALCDEPGVLCSVAGTGVWGSNGDGPADAVWLYQPTAVGFGPSARVEFADYNNHRIRALLSDGMVTTLAGTGLHLNAAAGPASLSPMENPIDLARCDDSGFFIAEQHAARVDFVDAYGTLSYFAGMGGLPGYTGDGGAATSAQLSEPTGVACGPDGAVYIADSLNHAIRVVHPDGIIGTLAGTGLAGYSDGPAEEAAFHSPHRLAVHDNSLYVADWLNSAIRRIDLADGTVSTVVGTGVAGCSGDGGPAVEAQLAYAIGVAFGADGSMYIADSDNHVIRRVNPRGTIETVVGRPCDPEPSPGFAGDGGPALDGQLHWPNDVALGPDGKLWIADTFNSRIRTVAAPN